MKRAHIAALTGLSLLVGLAAGTAGYAALRLARSAKLAGRSHSYDRVAEAQGSRLLVIGDGTGSGAGASAPERSLPGLLSRANPALTVVNRAQHGACFGDLLSQLDGDEPFDAVLVLGGGNDVIRMRPLGDLRHAVEQVAQRARVRADLVVFMPPGNLGNARPFLPPWDWWMAWRSRRLNAIVSEVARANGALCVSLYQTREDDPFARHSGRMHSKDALHPSDAGYELWQRELETQVQLSARLRKIGRTAAWRGADF
ncbi:GDSL-type esterase/lipase family protein [Variovorax ureilyticus]|uniref:GDSL-type esterase/lipase family protein n=1 Tax=Variovorax ureilyticus TaxID=1836198 RepID=A0ABU8VER2_9BURK